MRVYRFVHQIALRFSAMDETEASDLNAEAMKAYQKALFDAQSKKILVESAEADNAKHIGEAGYPKPVPKLSPKESLLLTAETWYARYGFALAYIAVVPMLNSVMNGDEDETAEEADEALKFAQAYTMFSKHKRS